MKHMDSLEKVFSTEDAPDLNSIVIDTYVEDIEPVYVVRGGYGIWELALIHKIMIKLWNDFDNPKYKRITISNKYAMPNLSLFNEVKKIYENNL